MKYNNVSVKTATYAELLAFLYHEMFYYSETHIASTFYLNALYNFCKYSSSHGEKLEASSNISAKEIIYRFTFPDDSILYAVDPDQENGMCRIFSAIDENKDVDEKIVIGSYAEIFYRLLEIIPLQQKKKLFNGEGLSSYYLFAKINAHIQHEYITYDSELQYSMNGTYVLEFKDESKLLLKNIMQEDNTICNISIIDKEPEDNAYTKMLNEYNNKEYPIQ